MPTFQRHEYDPPPAVSPPPHLTDGYLVHAAALRSGYDTSLFADQTLLVKDPSGAVPAMSFAHGVPEHTELGAATMMHDKRIRRAMLQPVGIPMPRSASFSLGRGTRAATEFAAELGFPVVVKPAVGDPTIETRTDIQDERELIEAIDYLRTAPAYRPTFTSASYAFTAQYTPKEDTEQESRDSYRFLVEQQLTGSYVRLLLLGGEVVSVLELEEGPWGSASGVVEVLEETDPSLIDLGKRVWAALPGLAIATIDILLGTGHQHSLSEQKYSVVEVSERPWLHLLLQVEREIAYTMASRIMAFGSGGDFASDLDKEIAVSFRWEGVPDSYDLLEEFGVFARRIGVSGWLTSADPVDGTLSGHMQGQHSDIALLSEYAVGGLFRGERILVVDSIQTKHYEVDSFTVRD